MKNLLIVAIISLICQMGIAQDVDLEYIPEFKGNVSEAEYERGKYLLSNTVDQIKPNEELNYVDYWNLALSYSIMGAEYETALEYLKTSKSASPESFCKIANYSNESSGGLEKSRFFKLFGKEFRDLMEGCNGFHLTAPTVSELKKDKATLDLSQLNESMIDQLIVLFEKDQRYRTSTKDYTEYKSKQDQLDREVQEAMIIIFETYGYPGKDLVGEPYMNLSCLMLEHGGDTWYQEKYLPLVAQAYKKDQVSESILKMLLDRIYWKKTGKQIFGSHAGIPFQSADVINQVRLKYLNQ